jgi:PIN domain nuclease of toxin-antitoxin system
MKLLLDTHLLLWVAENSPRLSQKACDLVGDPQNDLVFSAASLWEIAIKNGLGREDFKVDARQLRRGLLENDYSELEISGQHAIATTHLLPIHKDPFDRMLIAQATVEGLAMITSDAMVARYGSGVILV